MPFDLKLTTPEGVRLEAEAEFVLVPGAEGDIGVLPGHSPLLSPMRLGHVVATVGGGTRRFSVSGGFVEIHPDSVLILAETAEAADDVDVDRARAARERERDRPKIRLPETTRARRDEGSAATANAPAGDLPEPYPRSPGELGRAMERCSRGRLGGALRRVQVARYP